MSNGILANSIFTFPRPDWHKIVKIALDIVEGLLCIHDVDLKK
jgi:hypothetical protein